MRPPALQEELRGAEGGTRIGCFGPLDLPGGAVRVRKWLFAVRIGGTWGGVGGVPERGDVVCRFPKHVRVKVSLRSVRGAPNHD